MTNMTPLLERNERFARAYAPVPLGLPTAQVVVVTCLDHRIDPARVFGLDLGAAPVIRNAGGRVTPSVIDDIKGRCPGQVPGIYDGAIIRE